MWKLPAHEVVRELREGRVTPSALIDEVEARLDATDGQVNAVPIRCFERAREQARKMEEARPTSAGPGYLYGLPVLVKDDKAVKGVPFVYGSPIYSGPPLAVAPMSDASVTALEASGGIVVGKTNLPEFAAGANTYNPVFGETLNPWDLSKTPGGSSGGSAAALAAGQGWLATGSDLGGSLRIPASFCGVVGMRPSATLVPREPPFPARRGPKPGPPPGAALQGVTGPMGRCVADVALLLEAQSPPGREGRAPPGAYIAAAAAGAEGGWARGAGTKVALTADLGGLPVEDEVKEITAAAARWFATQGAEVVDAEPASFRGAGEVFQTLRAHMMCAMGDLLASKRDKMKPELIWNVEKGLAQTEDQVKEAFRAHDALAADVAEFFLDHALLCCPVACSAPFDVKTRWLHEVAGRKQDNYVEWLYTCAVVTLTNCPAISVPCGLTKAGLPVGLQIVAPPGQDAALLEAAAAFEAAHGFASQVPRDPEAPG